jgi:hypothetical protein
VLHPYVRFRIRLTRHALAQLAASMRGSAEIVALLLGPALVGLLAVAALPPMVAASLPLPESIPLLAANAIALTAPLFLLRKRVLPLDVVQWLHALPVPPRVRLAADALVAAVLSGPLALAYALSLAVWLYQQPAWLQPLPAVTGTAVSLLLTWAATTLLLRLRGSMPAPRRQAPQARAAYRPLAQRGTRASALFLWHKLYWLPLWRADHGAGRQQAMLLLGALASALAWMLAPLSIPRGAWSLATSFLLVLLTDRCDKAAREQAARLRPVIAAWPLRSGKLDWLARALATAPALLVLALLAAAGLAAGAWQGVAGKVYLALACCAQPLLVATPPFTPRGRMGLVAISILLLTAVGSEIWK